MALFEPTNLRQENAAGDNQTVGINRYLKNTPARHGFLRNKQTGSGIPALTIEPARDRYRPHTDNPLSPRDETRTQAFNSRVQNGISTYLTNERSTTRNRPETQNTSNRNNKSLPELLTRNQAQNTTTEIRQPTGINVVIPPSTQANRAIEEYRNLSTAFGASQNTIQSDADRYLRTQQAIPLGAQLLVTPSENNQNGIAITLPPTLNLALSRGIEQYTLIDSPVEENGAIKGYTVDLYLSSNPTQNLLTQLLP